MRKREELSHEEPMINLTPLIDVVFVILFTFIVVAPLLEIDHVALAPGGSNGAHTSAEKLSPVTIHVYADNTVAFNKQLVSFDELRERLSHDFKMHPQETVQLFHDKTASFGTYQSVKNAVEGAGFEHMDVLLSP